MGAFVIIRSSQAPSAGKREEANRFNVCLSRSAIHRPKAWFIARFKAVRAC